MNNDHRETRSRIGASGSVFSQSPYSSRSASPASSIASSQGGSLQLFSPDSKAARTRQLTSRKTRSREQDTTQVKQRTRGLKINRGCNTDIGGDYTSLQQQTQVLSQNCQELRQENERLQQQITEGQQIINQLESQCDVTEENTKVQLQTVTHLMMKNVDHNLQFSRAQQEAQAYKQQVTDLKNQLRILQEENYSLATKVDDLKIHLDKKRQQVRQKRQDEEEQRQIISSLKNSFEHTNKKMQEIQKEYDAEIANSEQQNNELKLLQEKIKLLLTQEKIKKEQQKQNVQELQQFQNSMHACVKETRLQLQQFRDEVLQNHEVVQTKILEAKKEAKNLSQDYEESTIKEIGNCYQMLEDAIQQQYQQENISSNNINNNTQNITLRELSLNNQPSHQLQKAFNPLTVQFSVKLNKFLQSHQNLCNQKEQLKIQIDGINEKLRNLKNGDDETEIFGVQIKLAGEKSSSSQQQKQQIRKKWLAQGARFLPYVTLCCLTLASGITMLGKGGSSRRGEQRISGLEMYRQR